MISVAENIACLLHLFNLSLNMHFQQSEPELASSCHVTDDTGYKCCAGEVMVCVLDFKRDVGLWHGVLTVSS